MEMTICVQEILTQAQMLRLEQGGNKLCREHVFYGLLLAASYMDAPMQDEKYREEAKTLRCEMVKEIISISSAKYRLYGVVLSGQKQLNDIENTIERAAELCNSDEIDALSLYRALMEKPTPAIRDLFSFVDERYADEDAKYYQDGRSNSDETVYDFGDDENDDGRNDDEDDIENDDMAVLERGLGGNLMKILMENQNSLKTGIKQSKSEIKSDQEYNNREEKTDKPEDNANGFRKEPEDPVNLHEEPQPEAVQEPEEIRVDYKEVEKILKKARKKRKTKMGLFTYRGGPVKAAIKYFLYAFLVLTIIVALFETISPGMLDSLTKFPMFVWELFVALWLRYLIQGVSLIIGVKSGAFANFIETLADVGLVWTIGEAVYDACGLTEYTMILKIFICAAGLLMLFIRIKLFDFLKEASQVGKKLIMYRNDVGTAGEIFFKKLTASLIIPAILFSSYWVFDKPVQPWMEKVLVIYAMLWAWYMIFVMWTVIVMTLEQTVGKRKRLRWFTFLQVFHMIMLPALIVLGLHFAFSWLPVKTWVWIVLGIYTFIVFLMSVVYAREK